MGSSLWGHRESDTTERLRLSPLSQQISHNLGTLFRVFTVYHRQSKSTSQRVP